MWPFSSSYPEVACQNVQTEYDYIIAGGGTAGCALANRLSSDPSVSVLVVEAGKIADGWTSRVPLISANFMANHSGTYDRVSVPQSNLGGRKQHLISGKAIGGTTRINAMLYTRGSAGEYNAMGAAGRKGWAFDDVSPILKSAEHFFDKKVGPERGQDGEWTVRTHEIMYFAPTQRLVEAAQKVGLPCVDDLNSSLSPALGIAKCQYTMDRNAHRSSAYTAFLPEKLVKARKSHLTICTDTIVTKIHIKPGTDGISRAEGVYLRSASRKSISAYVAAKREVILCGGPLANPQILQLSGIGPRELLERHDITVIKDLPGVGIHFQDHQACPISFQVPMKDSIVSLEKNPLTAIKELFKYLTRGEGLFLLPIQEMLILAKSSLIDEEGNIHTTPSQLDASRPENIPDIELNPLAYEGADEPPLDKSKGICSILNACLIPKSKGTIRITSSDPDISPEYDPNFLSHLDDFKVLRAALRLSLAIVAQMRKAGYEMTPTRVPASNSDEDMDAFIRRWTRSTYHYSSTCRMAPEDDADSPGVVDDELRVYGVRGLRIADSSIFPQVPAAHTQAPAVMVGMKCAEMIKTAWKQ